ncbi:hypothetical protein [Halodesulfovibrio marinisediminis]|uniref:Lipoprotein n=1 Tax=Halodesulfovibrio marinisediminis DSM 17456 TaxID=1121457 RepID=A0A1N6E5K8_9BACT|nr:hypothetical protein [Halodesulfovibrio marinisediminis]SIN78299.1 hypothetical protein SAMN02745161_0726 [Halodesulfovibrio marinisediminis DSM 17456]
MTPTKRLVCMMAACVLLITAAGCGFKSDPKPASSADLFELKTIETSVQNPCINVSGDISGNIRNVDGLLIEVQKAGEQADCPGCPFKADEEFLFTPSELGLISNNGKFNTTICPTQISTLYRLKVTAKSKYFGMPDSTRGEYFIEMP